MLVCIILTVYCEKSGIQNINLIRTVSQYIMTLPISLLRINNIFTRYYYTLLYIAACYVMVM